MLQSVGTNTFSDSGCARTTTYCYQVSAVDASVYESGLTDQQCGAIYNISYDPYSLASSLTWDGQYIWVSNYVEGGLGGGSRKIYKYDITSGLSAGNIPSPSDWTSSLCYDGTYIDLVDYTDSGLQIFRISKDDGTIVSSFPIDYSPAQYGLAWDGQYLYLATYDLGVDNQPVSRIYKYDPSNGANMGIIYTRYGSYDPASGGIYSTIEGLTYNDASLWVLVDPDVGGGPFKIINISLDGQELSTMDVPDSENNTNSITGLTYIQDAFWYIRTTYINFDTGLVPNTELVRFAP
jgi:hypothetical protein